MNTQNTQASDDGLLIAVFFVILFGISLLLYFIPSMIAGARRHHNLWAIVALNVFLGWTFIGWVAAFVWSLTAVERKAAALLVIAIPLCAFGQRANVGGLLGAVPNWVELMNKPDNYPGWQTLTDGKTVTCFALETGQLQFRDHRGITRTVPLFDHGIPYDPYAASRQKPSSQTMASQTNAARATNFVGAIK